MLFFVASTHSTLILSVKRKSSSVLISSGSLMATISNPFCCATGIILCFCAMFFGIVFITSCGMVAAIGLTTLKSNCSARLPIISSWPAKPISVNASPNLIDSFFWCSNALPNCSSEMIPFFVSICPKDICEVFIL